MTVQPGPEPDVVSARVEIHIEQCAADADFFFVDGANFGYEVGLGDDTDGVGRRVDDV